MSGECFRDKLQGPADDASVVGMMLYEPSGFNRGELSDVSVQTQYKSLQQ